MEISNTLIQQITKVYETETTNSETHQLYPNDTVLDFFTDFSDNHIKRLTKGEILTAKKVRYSHETIKGYKGAVEMFKEFEKLLERRIRVTEVSCKLMEAFELFLCSKNLALNTISVYNSKILALTNILYKQEISFRQVKISTPVERTTKIYLSIDELQQIENCETLTNGERKVFDIFKILSFTAFRYSTLIKFLENPFIYIKELDGKSYIQVTADKTNKESLVPLSEVVISVLKKYEGRLTAPSEPYLNRTLKIIGRKGGIDNLVCSRKTIGGKMVETFVEKYTLLTSHSGRRTMVSLSKQLNIPDNVICAITGHSSVSAMDKYSRLENIDKIKEALDHPFFKISL